MRKHRMEGFLLGVVITLIMVSTSSVVAANVKANIEVIYNNIKLVVDGKPIELGKDSEGKEIEPFIYNGTTYLPVRSVGEAVGKEVDWDGKTQTVYLGEKPGEVNYMTEIIKPYNEYNIDTFRLNDPETFDISGTVYKTGYRHHNYNRSELKFNLNSQYKKLTFEYGPSKYYKKDPGVLNIYLDNKLYKSYVVDQHDPAKTETIDLNGVNQLRIETEHADGDTFIGIGDPIIE